MSKLIPSSILILSAFIYFVFSLEPKDFVIYPQFVITSDSENQYISISFDKKLLKGKIFIKKKPVESSSWFEVDTLPEGKSVFYDTIKRNQLIEYGFAYEEDTLNCYGYYACGEKTEVETNNGNVLILVDSTVFENIQHEINTFVDDLENDGWTSAVRLVPRSEVFNPTEVRKVKRVVNSYKRKWGDKFKVLLLIGRVPVPYTGNYTFDGHSNHIGAFPSDLVYVVDDSLLTDDGEYNISADREENWNVPFDQKFDQTSVPGTVSIAVGRIDFFNLKDFQESEVELLKRYFQKNHLFRCGKTEQNLNSLIDDGFGTQSNEIFASNAWMNFLALSDTITEGKFFENVSRDYFRFAYACNSGSYTSVWSAINSEQCATSSIKSTFVFLFGSYFWDWDSERNLLRSALASSPNTLITAWTGRPFWHLHHFAFGFPFSYSLLKTTNNLNLYKSTGKFGYKGMHIEIMGDPTLKIKYPEPVDSFAVFFVAPNLVKLAWEIKDTISIVGFQLMKKNLDDDRVFTTTILPSYLNTYIDTLQSTGKYQFQIKALYRQRNKLGSFINSSLGVSKIIEIR